MIANNNITYIYNTTKGVLFREHHVTKTMEDSVLYTTSHNLSEKDYNIIESFIRTNMTINKTDYEYMTKVRANILIPLFSLGM